MEGQEKIAELQAQLAAEKAARETLELKMQSGDTRVPIAGSYKGYRFDDGHRRVRDKDGMMCDTVKLLAAAKEKDPVATATLDWLIELKYAHFTQKKG